MAETEPTPGDEIPDEPLEGAPAEPIPTLPSRARFHEPQDDVPPEAVERSSPERQATAFEHARLCARLAEANRAREILLLDLRSSTPMFDFFVIATAPSRRQANAMVSEIDHEMKQIAEYKLGIEGSDEGRWTLIDYGDFVVHVLSAEAREYYALEDIWGDAPQLDWRDEGPLPPATS